MDELDYLGRIANALERIANVLDKFNQTLIKVDKKEEEIDLDDTSHTDAWVVQPYNICITTMPPQYKTTIYHYNSPSGLCLGCLDRGYNTHIFFTEKEAIDYCKINLGSEYEVVDIPTPSQIIIGDDYE